MKILALSVSNSIVDDEKIVDYILNLSSKNPRGLFLIDFYPREWTEKIEYVRFFPQFGKFTTKRYAFMNMYYRMAKRAHECYCIASVDDRFKGPIDLATEFKEMHPTWVLCVYMYDGKLHPYDQIRKIEEWESSQYR